MVFFLLFFYGMAVDGGNGGEARGSSDTQLERLATWEPCSTKWCQETGRDLVPLYLLGPLLSVSTPVAAG